MSDLEEAPALVSNWLQPLADDAGPCGPDLEYDNDFLALTQAAQGKPESQFGAAEPPDWMAVQSGAEAMFERTRDLRVAIYWLRAGLHLHGYRALLSGLQLITGLIEQLWDSVHPLPDPDDGDPYARVNALTVLRETEGVIGDFRATAIVRDRAVGELLGRSLELAANLGQPLETEEVPGLEQLRMIMAAAVERTPELKTHAEEALQALQALQALINDKLDSAAPDLKPLVVLAKAVVGLMPVPAGEEGESGDGYADGGEGGDGVQPTGRGRGLSGGVSSREEALRAIDMVCAYLERAEPSNPAPFFLRRARQLVNHNFLQLMKELAPTVMPDLARMVGVDPDSVETPEKS